MFVYRCHRADGLVRGGAAAGEVSVRAGGVLPDPVPQPAHQVRQAAAQTALPQDRVRHRHRAAVLRAARGQGSHRDHDQGHAYDRELPVAELLHERIHVTATTRGTRGLTSPSLARECCGRHTTAQISTAY